MGTEGHAGAGPSCRAAVFRLCLRSAVFCCLGRLLKDNQLTGTLPTELGELQQLQYLCAPHAACFVFLWFADRQRVYEGEG